MRFASPAFLLLFLLFPLLFYYYLNRSRRAAVAFPDTKGVTRILRPGRTSYRHIPLALRITSTALVILALARPQAGVETEVHPLEVVDIMLCIDTSTSMLAEDFQPRNRLEVAKEVVKEFIEKRARESHDRIGVVIFSAVAFTQCPLTTDYGALLEFLEEVKIGMTETDGTAIGDALATCLNHLKSGKAKSKLVIILTDGRNNMGTIDPRSAAKIGKTLGIKIYTIGVGKKGWAPYPVNDPIFGKQYVRLREDLDEETLTEIAKTTGGEYFRATDSGTLDEIFRKIDKMERTPVEAKFQRRYKEISSVFLWPACILFAVEVLLANTVLLRIP